MGIGTANELTLSINDMFNSVSSWQIWFYLGIQDIKSRYRRSKLGPFWLTLSMAITVYTMGFLYGKLFKISLNTYYPYLAAGMIGWALISNMIIELSESFVQSDRTMKQLKLPRTLFIFRTVWRNFIIYFHNLLAFLPIFFIFHVPINMNLLLIFVGWALLFIIGVFWGLAIATICARYRDLSQIVKSLIQVVFFLTPIMWSSAILPQKYHEILYLNPFNALVDIIRAPLLGVVPAWQSYMMCLILIAIGIILFLTFFAKYRKRIIYWL